MKVLVTGGAGQLAQAIERTWTGHDLRLVTRAELDVTDRAAVISCLEASRPDVVVNTAAFTQVDLCEKEVGRAHRTNAGAVRSLAEGCDRLGCLLVQVSTDYVFDGESPRPYVESDETRPLNVYGESKLEGERQALLSGEHLIVRTGWLYDRGTRNFLETMLILARGGAPIVVVDDQVGTPTSCPAFARQLLALVSGGVRGLVHASCRGQASWHAFAAEIFRLQGLEPDLRTCTTAQSGRSAARPHYSVLSNSRLEAEGVDVMPDWPDALREVLGG